MATLTIRNVDDDVHKYLRRQAAEHGRSVEAEVRAILSERMQAGHRTPGEIAREIHRRFAEIGGVDLELPEREPPRDPPKFK